MDYNNGFPKFLFDAKCFALSSISSSFLPDMSNYHREQNMISPP